jgi:hypothetical protein
MYILHAGNSGIAVPAGAVFKRGFVFSADAILLGLAFLHRHFGIHQERQSERTDYDQKACSVGHEIVRRHRWLMVCASGYAAGSVLIIPVCAFSL